MQNLALLCASKPITQPKPPLPNPHHTMAMASIFLQSPPPLLSLKPKLFLSYSLPKPTTRRPLLYPSSSCPTPVPSISLRHNIKHLPHFSPPNSLPEAFPSLPLPSLTLSPISVCKWSLLLSLSLALAKSAVSLLLNPFFWTYFSLAWPFYPYFLAAILAIHGARCFAKHSRNEASLFEQLSVVTSTIAWLTLVPVAHSNGFLQGWPLALFFVYHYFFFFESSVRSRLYGDLLPRPHDPRWDISLPSPSRFAFFALVLAGHFLAAHEGPELHLIPGGWANLPIFLLVLLTIFTRYHSVLYLHKYSEKVAVPTAVVQFGPYRWVRHPVYASTVMLFAVHCIALRAPLSLAFLVAVCLWYYGRKAELEEATMVDVFGDRYREYADKVRYRLIPLLY
ncbi:uncharacterized protein M6B38_279820 [Iris pallida]|uniref:Protein-S-isoprenylcysteine O-methyltransferase n=1 Tax=Iris pallida TaxID=29817 RepID=A0AAX6HZJ7_IRIPA|nr:uncharacterized protein M6B38_279820 [Iris pallida]